MGTGEQRISGYHAHIYYDPDTRGRAETLREKLGTRFEVELGRWHDEPVGPHPKSMYQVAFAPGALAELLPFLMLERAGLDVLLHPRSGDDVADHTEHAVWLGDRLELNIDSLRPAL